MGVEGGGNVRSKAIGLWAVRSQSDLDTRTGVNTIVTAPRRAQRKKILGASGFETAADLAAIDGSAHVVPLPHAPGLVRIEGYPDQGSRAGFGDGSFEALQRQGGYLMVNVSGSCRRRQS